jgi:exonuclease SbcC
MRPLKLSFAAFGPFLSEQTVDFGALAADGLFLIHGDTGVGKSSILDALTYALFKEASSGDVEKSRSLRNDRAEPKDETFVAFDFALGSERFRVRRCPEQPRPGRRGEAAVRRPAQASVHALDAGGGVRACLASSPRETDAWVAERIGFNAEQFRRVLLIPQGRFRDVLEGDAETRTELLRRIFDTSALRRFEESLRKRAAGAREAEAGIGARLEALWSEAQVRGMDGLEAAAAAAGKAATALEKEAQAAAREAVRARAESEGGRAAAAALERVRIRRAAVEAARAGAAARRAEAEALEAARRAERVDPPRRRGLEARERLAREEAALAEARSEEKAARACSEAAVLASGEARSGRKRSAELEAQAAVAEALIPRFAARERARASNAEAQARREVAAETLRLKNLKAEEAERDVRSLADSERVCAEAATRLPGWEAEARWAEERRKAAEERLVRVQKAFAAKIEYEKRVLECEAASQTAAEAEAAERRMATAREAAFAAEAARTLEPGLPCPVCGSTQHPAPALGGGIAPAPQEWEAIRSRRAETAETWAQARAAREGAEALWKALAPEEHAAAEPLSLEDARRRETEAQAAVAEGKRAAGEWARLKVLLAERQTASEKARREAGEAVESLHDAESAAAAAGERLRAAESELVGVPGDAAVTAQRARALREEARALQLKADAAEAREAAAARALAAAERALVDGGRRLEEARTLASEAKREWLEALAREGFPDGEAWKAAHLKSEERELRETAWNAACRDADAAEKALEEAEAAAPGTEMPDLPRLEQETRLAEEKAQAAERTAAAAQERRKVGLERLERARALTAEWDRKAGESARWGALDALVRGAGGRGSGIENKVSFERFVLAAWLDEILETANLHLGDMSGHRFALVRRVEERDQRLASGLNLDVLDAFNGGKARTVRSLSGGESFKAALALALALAEGAERAGGGRPLECLFVDEGFGSLDQESLSQVLRTLVDLRRNGRLVGVISHVESLKDRIPGRIRVRRDGIGGGLIEQG